MRQYVAAIVNKIQYIATLLPNVESSHRLFDIYYVHTQRYCNFLSKIGASHLKP